MIFWGNLMIAGPGSSQALVNVCLRALALQLSHTCQDRCLSNLESNCAESKAEVPSKMTAWIPGRNPASSLQLIPLLSQIISCNVVKA